MDNQNIYRQLCRLSRTPLKRHISFIIVSLRRFPADTRPPLPDMSLVSTLPSKADIMHWTLVYGSKVCGNDAG